MASWKLVAVSVAVLAYAVTFSSAQLRVLGCPGAPWCPVWVKCNYTDAPGSSCHDCTTRVVCTPVGGLLRPCKLPGLNHCANGYCQTKPTSECDTEAPPEAPEAPEVPTEVPEAPEAPTKAPEAPEVPTEAPETPEAPTEAPSEVEAAPNEQK